MILPYPVRNTIPNFNTYIPRAPNSPFWSLILEAVSRKRMKPGNKMKMGEEIGRKKKVDGERPKSYREV